MNMDELFQAFKFNYNLCQKKQFSESFFQSFLIEMRQYKVNEEEAFHYLMSSEEDEVIISFLDILYNFEKDFISLAQKILLQKKMSLSDERLIWFLNKMVNAPLDIQKEIFELSIVECNIIKYKDEIKPCLNIVSTYREKDIFSKNYCTNIFTYLVHCFNQSIQTCSNQTIINISQQLIKNYQQIYHLNEKEIQQAMLPTLLAFSSSIYISSFILKIFNSNIKDKNYHPYLVLPLRETSNLGLSNCRNIFKFYFDNNIDYKNTSPNGENVLCGIFIHLIGIHYINNSIDLLKKDLIQFSNFGYNYQKFCVLFQLDTQVNEF